MKNWDYCSIFIGIIAAVFNSCNSRSEESNSFINAGDGHTRQTDIITYFIDWHNDSIGYFHVRRDGKEYRVVKIHSQIWFAENLSYKPGEGDFWSIEDDPNYISEYGYLYFWETAKDACPEGWHLPSLEEWNILVQNLGGKAVAGGNLKSTSGWSTRSEKTTNISGMSILPAGNKAVDGSYFHLGEAQAQC